MFVFINTSTVSKIRSTNVVLRTSRVFINIWRVCLPPYNDTKNELFKPILNHKFHITLICRQCKILARVFVFSSLQIFFCKM